MASKIDVFIDKIKKSKSILIVGHKNPDGDSLCSVLALAGIIKQNFGKEPVCLYDGNIPDYLDKVPYRDDIIFCEHFNLSVRFDLAIVLDFGTVAHIGGALPLVKNSAFRIEIDHHKNFDHIGDLCINKETASSVGEVLYEIAKSKDLIYDKDVAELITVSILTDTGNFKYCQTGKALRIVADLVDKGIYIKNITDKLNNKPWKTVKTEAAVVAKTEFFYDRKLAVAIVDTKDYKNLDGRGDIILGLLEQTKGIEYIVLLKQQKINQIGISFRSREKSILHIAESFGGGGHPCAAGAVAFDSLENVKKQVIKAFKGQ